MNENKDKTIIEILKRMNYKKKEIINILNGTEFIQLPF